MLSLSAWGLTWTPSAWLRNHICTEVGDSSFLWDLSLACVVAKLHRCMHENYLVQGKPHAMQGLDNHTCNKMLSLQVWRVSADSGSQSRRRSDSCKIWFLEVEWLASVGLQLIKAQSWPFSQFSELLLNFGSSAQFRSFCSILDLLLLRRAAANQRASNCWAEQKQQKRRNHLHLLNLGLLRFSPAIWAKTAKATKSSPFAELSKSSKSEEIIFIYWAEQKQQKWRNHLHLLNLGLLSFLSHFVEQILLLILSRMAISCWSLH